MSQPCSWGLKSSTCIGRAKFSFRCLGTEAIALLLEAVKTFMIAVFVFDILVGKRMKTDRRTRNWDVELLLLSERDLIVSSQVNETIVFIDLRTNGTTILFRNVSTKCTKGNGNQSCVKQLTVGFPAFPFLDFVQEYIQLLVELYVKRFFVTIWFYFVWLLLSEELLKDKFSNPLADHRCDQNSIHVWIPSTTETTD